MIIGLLMLLIFLTVVPSPEVHAVESGNSVNSMTSSMIEFFRKEQTEIDVERVSRDDFMVYGVFLSNFFIPGKTKLKDLVDPSEDKEDTLPKKISTKFFGSSGNYKQIIAINDKLYKAITEELKTSRSSFSLYASLPSEDSKVMSGTDLYNKLAGVDEDRKIYGNISSPDRVVMDLNDNATRASMQVLFSFAPELILDKEKGLRAFHSLYIDGLGNIWGAYDNVSVEEYVLILPAALNPIVFSKTTNGGKFPVANVFVMGGIVKITEDFLANRHFMTPYYNIKDYFTTGTTSAAIMNTKNMLNIFGLQSPSSNASIGITDVIIELSKSLLSNPYEDVKSFLSENTMSTSGDSNSMIILTIDASKFTDGKKYFEDESSLTVEQKATLFEYLFNGSIFPLSELADDMYYFDVINGASGLDEGNWNDDNYDDLIKRQKLFSKEVDGNFHFYNNSYFSSPFNRFLKRYFEESSKGAQEGTEFLINYLRNHTLSKDIDPTSDEFQALKSFLDSGNFGTGNPEVINKAMKLLKFDEHNFVYNILPSSTSVNLNTLESGFPFFKATKVAPAGFGLLEFDNRLAYISSAIRESSFWKKFTKGFPTSGYFEFEGTGMFSAGNGGKIIGYDDNGKTVGEHGQNAISTLFYSAMVYRIFGMNSAFASQIDSDKLYAGDKVSGALGEYTVKTSVVNGVNNYPGIYWGYMVQLLNIRKDGDVWKTEPFSNPLLPYMAINNLGGSFNLNEALNGSTGVVASEEKTLEEMQKDIVKKVYGLLADGPSNYRDKLVKATQDSWIIQTHRAITGSWVGNFLSVSAGGNNSYASIVGYINSPSLHDIPLTSWLLDDYMYVYLFFYLLILIMVILMLISHIRSLREGVLILILMAFILVLPQFLVGNVINISNSFGDRIYSSRFDYWAITQHQQSFETLLNAQSSGDELNYIIAKNAMSLENVYTTDVGVRVKWMAPKRDGVFDSLFTKGSPTSSLTSNLTIFRWLFNSFLNQQEYVYNDPLATYLYRPYNAIAEEARTSYESLEAFDESVISLSTVSSSISTHSKKVLGLPSYRFMLFNNPEGLVPYSDEQKELITRASVFPYSFSGVFDDKLSRYRFWALGNENVTKAIFNSEFTLDPTVSGISGDLSNPFYKAYVLSTESPFYYFYNVFKMRYSSGVSGVPDFKSALLKREVFKVENSGDPRVDGKLRDFLDLEGLFKYVIPYLHQGNEYVDGWTTRYGADVQGFDFDNANNSASLGQSSDFQFQQKKKQTLKNVWNLYAPWVDQLYGLDSVSEEIEIAGKKVYLDDTLNPGAYELLGRSMIFSPADMIAKSYNYGDLTDVERRIQATLESTYKDLLYLTNYRDFDDEVLVTAAAMAATFNFNREFSEYKFLGESSILYPQNFELKNFNYDAFMRLLLLNATGEPLMADKDLYVRILDKTSFFTGLVLLADDIMAVYVIPAFKVVVLLLLLLLSFVIVVSCVLSPPPKIVSVILKNLGLPSILFMVASTIFAFVISLFMGEGQTAYVGGRVPSLGLTDPTIMMSLMLIVDGVYLYVLWRIVKLLLDSFKAHLSTTFVSSWALLTSAGAMLKQMSGRVLGTLGNGAFGLAKFGYKRGKFNQMLDAVENLGTGGVSSSSTVGSSGSSSGAGSSGGPGGGFKSRPTKPSKSSGGFGQEDIDALASKPVYNESKPFSSIQKRSIGERVVDFKYGLRNKYRDVRDSVSEFGGSVKSTMGYIRSKDGLRRYVSESLKTSVDNVKMGARDTANSLKYGINDRISKWREHSALKAAESADRERAKLAENPFMSARQRERIERRIKKDDLRFSSLAEKVAEHDKKAKLLRSKSRLDTESRG